MSTCPCNTLHYKLTYGPNSEVIEVPTLLYYGTDPEYASVALLLIFTHEVACT